MRHLIFATVLTLIFFSCKRPIEQQSEDDWFIPLKANFDGDDLLIAKGFEYDLLFSEKDSVYNAEGRSALARNHHDGIVYLPIDGSSEHGYIFVNHETEETFDLLGDGGGVTTFEVKLVNGKWQVISDFEEIDFRPVGGTYANCGTKLTPYGTILTMEEAEPKSNADIKGIEDQSNYNGRKKHLNYGWVVEYDPATKKALRKLYHMGRYAHEDVICMPDGRTVYLTNDDSIAVFFKFVADSVNDYGKGQLYAYSQTEDTNSGTWIELPMQMDSLIKIREIAIAKGATLFARHEWMTMYEGKIYISETGKDKLHWQQAIQKGAKPAHYFKMLPNENNIFEDPYGRILVYNPSTEQIQPYLQGGKGEKHSDIHLSNPDGITAGKLNGKTCFFLSEDLIGKDKGRVSDRAKEENYYMNEVYVLDASIQKPTLDDLKRFLIAPKGAEPTGGVFTPDGKTMFICIQHPDKDVKGKVNTSTLIAVRGF